MAYGSDPSRQQRFKRVKEGDLPSAGEWNKICIELERLTAGEPRHPKKPTRAIKLIRLSAPIGQFGEGDPSISGDGDSSQAHRRSGVVWYYDETADKFLATSDEETKHNITDALRLIYDADEFLWCVYLEQSGHWHPINPRTVRHAKTVNDHNGRYPDDCERRIFPIKFVRMQYDRDIDAASPVDGSYLDGGDGSPDDYVLNLFAGTDLHAPYIPKDTVIWCYNVLGQWYTWICCFNCLDSSSSSSSSSPIDSVSSDSSNSSSPSSGGSSFSSASSSGGSSASSSSQGSSLSSVEFSSSSDSSISVSGSVEISCLTLVTSVSFDSGSCILSYSTVCLCWDSSLPISFRTGNCQY